MTLDEEFQNIVSTVASAQSLEEIALAIENSRWYLMLESAAVYARHPDAELDEFKARFARSLGHDHILTDEEMRLMHSDTPNRPS